MRSFEPWKGSQYRTSGFKNVRVLILGESHYAKPEELSSTFTQGVVRSRGIVENPPVDSPHRFFTTTAKLLLNAPPHVPLQQTERTHFWQSVAFYNYIQSFVGTTSRTRPTRQMWLEASSYLPAVLAELNPQLLLVLGKELSTRLPQVPPNIIVCKVPHPASFGFKLIVWQTVVQAALSEAAANGT